MATLAQTRTIMASAPATAPPTAAPVPTWKQDSTKGKLDESKSGASPNLWFVTMKSPTVRFYKMKKQLQYGKFTCDVFNFSCMHEAMQYALVSSRPNFVILVPKFCVQTLLEIRTYECLLSADALVATDKMSRKSSINPLFILPLTDPNCYTQLKDRQSNTGNLAVTCTCR